MSIGDCEMWTIAPIDASILQVHLQTYQLNLAALPYGKRLPTAVYLLWDRTQNLLGNLDELLRSLSAQYSIGDEFNIIKFHTHELKVSFLSYPSFFDAAHPVLARAIVLDLVRASRRDVNYERNLNPPILHRKESFLPIEHFRRAEFAALTQSEEQEGLFDNPATIGFKLNWEKLLSAKAVIIVDHELRRQDGESKEVNDSMQKPVVHRHKTALTRYDLSRPVKGLLEHGLLKRGVTILDYGCGQGSDIEGLLALGYDIVGWDPVHRRDGTKRDSDIVNLGYVLNVIEDPAERLDALVDAYGHARRLLVVSALIQETVATDRAATYSDGVLTRRGTFQKFFDQHELHQYIEDALESPAVPVGLGVFYVFRAPAEHQDFLASRSRRAINWQEISKRLGFSRPGPRKPRWVTIYEDNSELLDSFWAKAIELGRQPAPFEFSRHIELAERVGSPKVAMRLLVERGGGSELESAAENRRNDLLVYLGLANLRKKVPFGQLSQSLRFDIRSFFGNYQAALSKGLELLYAAGDPGEIELACENLNIGWQDKQALYFHKSLLIALPGVLRAYVGCALALFGDIQQADLVKLHKASGKVTFLKYDDFENKQVPELQQRIKVNLRNRWVEAFDYSLEGQLLYYKERFVAVEHPRRSEMESFSARLRDLGIPTEMAQGPKKIEFEHLRQPHHLDDSLKPD
jgi:DNA phosphorothioation-associated putative methyltransferase